jgi:SLT domain-containing protein
MAYTEEELTRIMRQVEEEMAAFGRITQETADSLTDAKVGVKGFSDAVRKGGSALGSLGQAATASAKAMYENKQGASAFNDSLDKMSDAAKMASLALAAIIPGGPIIKAFVVGVGVATEAVLGLAKASNQMADQLYKGYTSLAKSGAAASDGMSGVFKGAQKLGLGMDQLGSYVELVNNNAKDLATFGGSVFEGRKKFEEMGKAMEPYRQQLMAAGYTQEEINDASMQYLRLQTRIGQTQNLTTQQLADGAKKYLFEQEALTKLTGMSRQEQEQALEAARSQQRFRAKLEEMRNSGDEKQIAAANEMEATYKMLYKYNKEAATGFGDIATGMIGSEAAIKFHMQTLGEGAVVADKMAKSQISAVEGFEIIGKASGKTAKEMNMLGQVGAFDEVFGNFAGAVDLGIAANRDMSTEYANVVADMKKQREGADEITDQYTARLKAQQEIMLSLQKTVADSIGKSGDIADEMTDLSKELSGVFKDLAGVLKDLMPVIKMLVKGIAGAVHIVSGLFHGWGEKPDTGGMSFDPNTGEAVMDTVEARATGGPVGEGKPYIVGEKGPELFVPKNAGEIISSDAFKQMVQISDGLYDKTDNSYKQIIKFNNEILDDTRDLAKISDADLRREKAYSNFLKEYTDAKMDYLRDDLDTTKELADLKTGGGGTGGMPGFTSGLMNMFSGAGAKAPAGGVGIKSGGSGAPGLQAMGQRDLAGLGLKMKAGDVQAEGAGISPDLIQLAQSIQSNLPGFSYFSGFNDKFHNESASGSKHTQGRALDFALNYAPTKEQGAQIVSQLKSMGANFVLDEYNNPSSKATAGHIHAEIPAYANGGLVMKPQIAMIGEKGPEAVVPLDRELIDYKALAQELRSALMDAFSGGGSTDLGSTMAEMVRLQKESVDTQQRILQVSYN